MTNDEKPKKSPPTAALPIAAAAVRMTTGLVLIPGSQLRITETIHR